MLPCVENRLPPRAASPLLGPSLLLGALVLAWPGRAQAEQTMLDGEAAIASGAEGGDPGTGTLAWRRARARVIAGAEWRYDEAIHDGIAWRAFAELEGRATLGGEMQYRRWVSDWFTAYAGLSGLVAPETALGGLAGARFTFPMGRLGLFLDGSFTALPLGSEVPNGSVLLWALVSGGVRVSL